MNKLTTLLATSFTLLLGTTGTYAQDAPTWAPLEIIGCSFVDDADMGDFDAVVETWNEWMDDNGMNDYTAYVLSPHFTAASFAFDLIWVGVWDDGAALSSMQQWLTEGGDVLENFLEVTECLLHQAFAVTNIKQPGEPTGVVPVEFSNCTLHEGRVGPEARNALIEWTEFLAENGSDSGHWILRPGPGLEADDDYSFKWVTSYSSWESIGHDFELYFNGGGAAHLNDLTGSVMSCDSSRLYNSRMVRESAEESS